MYKMCRAKKSNYQCICYTILYSIFLISLFRRTRVLNREKIIRWRHHIKRKFLGNIIFTESVWATIFLSTNVIVSKSNRLNIKRKISIILLLSISLVVIYNKDLTSFNKKYVVYT